MSAPNKRGQAFIQRLSGCLPERNGHPHWLTPLRQTAFEWVSAHDFPTTRDEAWKYTQVSPILDVPFQPATQGIGLGLSAGWVDRHAGQLGGIRLVFVNGFFAKELSSFAAIPQGAQITNWASVLEAAGGDVSIQNALSQSLHDPSNAFTALNTAFARDGAYIRIPKNVAIETPIHLVFVSGTDGEPIMSHPKSVIVAEPGSVATVVETHIGAEAGGRYFNNTVTDATLGEGAVLTHFYVQNEAETAFHISHLSVRPGAKSQMTTHSIALGAAIGRQEVKVTFEAPGAHATLNGLYMPMNKQHLDSPTLIEHIAPQCESRTFYKGVIGG
jgi:Fe-S cluster assembly protein SufD